MDNQRQIRRRVRRALLAPLSIAVGVPLAVLGGCLATFATGLMATGDALAIWVGVASAALVAALAAGALESRRRGAGVAALVAAAERMARQDFTAPAVVAPGDELEELERALVQAARSTRRLLDRLHVGAEFDRRILTSKAIGPVLDFLLKRFDRFVDCRFATVALADFENECVLTVHSANLDDHQTYSVRRIQLQPEDRDRLLALEGSLAIGPDDALFDSLIPDDLEGVAELDLVPVKNEHQLLGFMALGDCRGDAAAPVVKDLRNRLALAFSMAEREQTLFMQAHFDPLTNLPNRFLSIDRLEQELARSERTNTQLGLLFIDLDRFKSINDSLGHAAGDALLQAIAQRLLECFRDADTVARLGGDEFIVLLPDIDHPKAAGELADRVAKAFEDPIMLLGSAVYASASVGIAVYPMDGRNAEELLRNADQAMYRAKQSGSGGKAFFTEELNVSARRRLRLEAELRQIIRNRELELVFQPQISLTDGSLTSVEALLRWPGHRVAPDEFVPLAEDTGLIHDIGFWVLETACRAVVSLGDRLPKLAINVSPAQLRNAHFADRVLETLSRHELSPDRLELEITERLLEEPNADTHDVLEALAESGIGLSIHDFATGQTSLRALPDHPITALKIDRSFVAGAIDNPHERLLIESLVRLAHGLGLPVVAQGIESREQLDLVRELGCDAGQGYLFSHPISLEQLECFVAGQATRQDQFRDARPPGRSTPARVPNPDTGKVVVK